MAEQQRGTYNQKSMIKLLEANGWVLTHGGTHSVKMEKDGRRPITLPMQHRQDYGKRLAAGILKSAGLK